MGGAAISHHIYDALPDLGDGLLMIDLYDKLPQLKRNSLRVVVNRMVRRGHVIATRFHNPGASQNPRNSRYLYSRGGTLTQRQRDEIVEICERARYCRE